MTEALTELDFQRAIVKFARIAGWRHLHVRRSVGRGRRWVTATNVPWPDLALWRPDRFLLAELKTNTGQLTTDQAELLDSLRLAGVECYVWRPSDWPQIEHVLTAHRLTRSVASDPMDA